MNPDVKYVYHFNLDLENINDSIPFSVRIVIQPSH